MKFINIGSIKSSGKFSTKIMLKTISAISLKSVWTLSFHFDIIS